MLQECVNLNKQNGEPYIEGGNMTLQECIDLYNDLDKEIDKLSEIFPCAFESELVEKAWIIAEALLETVAKENGISADSLFWFMFDNEQGKNAYELNDIPIKDLQELLFVEKNQIVKLKDGTPVCYKIVEYIGDSLTIEYLPESLAEKQLFNLTELIRENYMN